MWAVFIFATIIAIILTVIFAFGLRNTGPWGSIWVFFVIVFLVAVVAGEWATPIGPTFFGLYWIPIVFITLVIAFLIAAATPTPGGMRPIRRRKRFDQESRPDSEVDHDLTDEEEGAAIGIFVYIILTLLIIAAIAGAYR